MQIAATIGGMQFGVAKKAVLVSVRFLNCDGLGSLGGFLSAMEFVIRDRVGGVSSFS